MEGSTLRGTEAGHHASEAVPAAQEAEQSSLGPEASLQDSDSDEGSTQSESTWLSRAQYRTEELRRLFALPEGEVGAK